MVEHVEPQSIPPTFEVTTPRPVFAAVSVRTPWNVAVTVFAASIVVWQVVAVATMQFADQPTKTEPVEAAAVSVTVEAIGKRAEQAEPHEMPLGEEVTAPAPVPRLVFDTVSVAAGAKDAPTERAAFATTAQVVVVPPQSPDQPVNTDPEAAVAVRVTVVP